MSKLRRKCIYAGSFDPLTLGHFWMIQEGARLFDELVVAIGVNPQKTSVYPVSLRLQMMQDALAEFPNVSITSFVGQFLVDFATTHGADFILRGIRGESDFEYERGMRYINDRIHPGISTVFLIPPKHLSETSSSQVRGLMGPPGWTSIIQEFVPPSVFKTLLAQHLEQQFLKAFSRSGVAWTEAIASDWTLLRQMELAECLAELETAQLSSSDAEWIRLALWGWGWESKKRDLLFSELGLTQSERALFKECWESDRGLPWSQKSKRGSLEFRLRTLRDIQMSLWAVDEVRFLQTYCKAQMRKGSYWDSMFSNRKILKKALGQKPLFRTAVFQERYEQRARSNLTRFIESTEF
jgi:pantetheine-phosphate adenylyltransferase